VGEPRVESGKHRIYIDESGNPDVGSSTDPNHRFLSLTGVILDLDYVQQTLHPEMNDLKERFFCPHPDDPVILHGKEILNAKPPFTALKDKETRSLFDGEVLTLLARWDYRVITVCLDKQKHRDRYSDWRYHPYHYCLATLIERFVLFLKRFNSKGDVMAESRGGTEDGRLKEEFRRLSREGTDNVSQEMFQMFLTSRELKIKPKLANVAGLQLADLLAHPSRIEILHESNLWDRDVSPFAEEIWEILSLKYDTSEGQVNGKELL